MDYPAVKIIVTGEDAVNTEISGEWFSLQPLQKF